MAPDYSDVNLQTTDIADAGIRELENNLLPLPNSLNEVNAISELFKGTKLIGGQANEHDFKLIASEYNILHFAMHTLINDEDPLSSKLVFALNGDTVDDGFLNTYEVYNLDLNANLAVLSACKTGAGSISKGEGIMSLARGFLYAGVPGIVMTLWAVEDISSATIITKFYEYLKEGDSKSIALKKAKLDYLRNAEPARAHPYFWAAYVQIGDNSPLQSNQLSLYYYAASFGAILLILLLFIRKRKTKSV